jgi:hypothetical protein
MKTGKKQHWSRDLQGLSAVSSYEISAIERDLAEIEELKQQIEMQQKSILEAEKKLKGNLSKQYSEDEMELAEWCQQNHQKPNYLWSQQSPLSTGEIFSVYKDYLGNWALSVQHGRECRFLRVQKIVCADSARHTYSVKFFFARNHKEQRPFMLDWFNCELIDTVMLTEVEELETV